MINIVAVVKTTFNTIWDDIWSIFLHRFVIQFCSKWCDYGACCKETRCSDSSLITCHRWSL